MGRMSWEDYFKTILFDVAKRSTCLRRSVGAIAIKDRRIIATGYNGQIMGNARWLIVFLPVVRPIFFCQFLTF